MPIEIIKEPIYQTHVHFIFDTQKEKAFSHLKKYINPLNFDMHWTKAGFTYCDTDNHDYFIVLPNTKNKWGLATIIAHESLHVTSKVLRGKGIKLSDESEEAFTYYQTWILQSLLDIYNKHKKRGK